MYGASIPIMSKTGKTKFMSLALFLYSLLKSWLTTDVSCMWSQFKRSKTDYLFSLPKLTLTWPTSSLDIRSSFYVSFTLLTCCQFKIFFLQVLKDLCLTSKLLQAVSTSRKNFPFKVVASLEKLILEKSLDWRTRLVFSGLMGWISTWLM